ncbi:MAG TPA: OmpA family protein [Bryocella sp.]|nr:OmpA family protein [Bryocella sp.]
MKTQVCVLLVAALFGTAGSAQEARFTVRLSQPLSTAKDHKGDPVAAKVVSPDDFKGDTIRGTVTESKPGSQPELSLAFDTLDHDGTTVPISATVTSLANSKGQQNMDEDGHVVRQANRRANANAARQIGSSLGGFLGGRKAAALNTASDVASALSTVQISGEGPNLSFASGSELGVTVSPRGGPDPASLPPNPPAAPLQTASVSAAGSAAPMQSPAAVQSTAAGTAGVPSSGTAAAQPDLRAVPIDFVPGEKTVFYDDFSDMAQDEPPPHWKLRDGRVELRTNGEVHQLTTVCPAKLSLSSQSFTFPKNFTMEMEAVFGDDGGSMDLYAWPKGVDGGMAPTWHILLEADQAAMEGPGGDVIGKIAFNPHAVNRPIKIALWVQNGRARAYVDGQRIGDVNQMFVPEKSAPADHWTIRQRCDRPGSGPEPAWIGIRSIRVAESAPDFSAVMASSGKYVTHGIVFDTDSDRLKPESAPVLKAVAQGLQKNPNLKLEIEGFTDSTGNSAQNMDLSKRRAEAVRSVLVSQFNVDGARLTANGFGAGRPVASNDTPEGRAANRRVEFVKQ